MQNVHRTIKTKSRKICSVPQCSTYATKEISLHGFPSDPKLWKTWKTVLKIGKPVSKYMLVCSLHFEDSDFHIATNERRRLKKGVIPSKKIPVTRHPPKQKVDRSERHWLQKCIYNNKEDDEEMPEDTEQSAFQQDEEQMVDEPSTSIGHDYAKRNQAPQSRYKEPLSSKFQENKATETHYSDFFELPQILDSDKKLLHFAGINSDILRTIKKCAENTAKHNNCHWPNMEKRILLVLCKFKMNISFSCLAVLFKVTKTLCTKMFYSTVSLLCASLKPAIYWPTKEQILNNMPKCFEKFQKTRVVLDCTEIKIQKLKCLKCRIMSYSHYKGTHTIKYLIGITPSGLISFVSNGFGGRATDKAIFNYEGLINKVDMHDAIMVDKGILIEMECEEKLVKLIRPPFLKKQKQFTKKDADTTAEIARARVHVERAIQRMKIFKILHEQFSWYLIPYVDEIVTIIAAMVNLSPPILADDKIS